MRFETIMLTALTVPLLLSGCGGGSEHVYDGTWQAVYPALSKQSTVSDTTSTLCGNPPVSFTISGEKGTVTLIGTCTKSNFDTATSSWISLPPETSYAIASIHIELHRNLNEKDVMNAVVNGVPFTGSCISTNSCSALSAAGESIGISR